MIRTAVGATLCTVGLASMVPGVLLITVGKRLAEGPRDLSAWHSYLNHPSARQWAAHTVRGAR